MASSLKKVPDGEGLTHFENVVAQIVSSFENHLLIHQLIYDGVISIDFIYLAFMVFNFTFHYIF